MTPITVIMKKCSKATQTLRVGCSKADPETNTHRDRGDYKSNNNNNNKGIFLNINYCVRGGHKPARWPWPTSPMPYTC